MRVPCHPRRNAMTLLELLLVLALLVILAGIAIPSFDAMVTSRRLQQSIEKLHNELLSARVTAMRTGQAQVFQCVLNGQEYAVKPWLNGGEAQNASVGATVMQAGQVVKTESTGNGGVATQAVTGNADPTKVDPAKKESTRLGEGVQFAAVESLIDNRNALAIQQSTGTVPTSGAATAGGLSSPILIYPDGSSTTAQLILADARGRRMAIQLRGVTGTATILKLKSVDPSTLATVSK